MRDLSPFFVASDQNRRHAHDLGITLTEELAGKNVPAAPSDKLRVDLMHTVDGSGDR